MKHSHHQKVIDQKTVAKKRFYSRLAVFAGILFTVVFCELFLASPAQAENWAFRRSYYSHAIPQEVAANYPQPVSRSAYRQPYKPYGGVAIRGGYRYNHVFLRSGNNVDHTVLWEGWGGVQQP